jgi:hypothetical protein
MGSFYLKQKDGVYFRHFSKCRHFESILFELGAVHYSRLPIFVLIRFWEIRNFLTNRLRESACILYTRNWICSGIKHSGHNNSICMLFTPKASFIYIQYVPGLGLQEGFFLIFDFTHKLQRNNIFTLFKTPISINKISVVIYIHTL